MLIGVCGFIGSGKGAASDILYNKYGYKKLSFADTVKDATATMFGWDRCLLEGDTEESREFRECPDPFWTNKFGRPFTPREALQKIGTEAGRNVFHDDLWIYALERKLQATNTSNIVIPDVRFPNEIKFIEDQGGVVIRVKRGPEPDWYNMALEDNAGINPEAMTRYGIGIHYSEWAWIGQKFFQEIENEGTLSDLESKIKELLTELQDCAKVYTLTGTNRR